jgi:hypothetical protein
MVMMPSWFGITIITVDEQQFPSVGASGLTFAFGGALLGFAVLNVMSALPKRLIESEKRRANLVVDKLFGCRSVVVSAIVRRKQLRSLHRIRVGIIRRHANTEL